MRNESFTNGGSSSVQEEITPVFCYNLTINQITRDYWIKTRHDRSAEVVLVVRRGNGRYLVHTKTFYPTGCYRLMTGGIKPGEAPGAAALRETFEETGLQVVLDRYLARIDYEFHYEAETLPFSSYVILLRDQGGTPKVHDEDEEISGFREVTRADLLFLADQLDALQGDSWADWGRFRAPAHRIAYQLLEHKNAPSI